ncbi:DUF3558 domain-containing protein [Tsukamurella strandjordii]|uniref:DUF3558 domain-containing protein n=1 Tax=Tsukamurella strandjordii TaxID=147577 RepID=A0AA90SRG5_9ACTN|nr:DUF3558 domain-containing protein [Tsukamurella strandjordii]MDP0398946.1 DUF3558 domain-containing protein [Tsukamurella strandjordii]
MRRNRRCADISTRRWIPAVGIACTLALSGCTASVPGDPVSAGRDSHIEVTTAPPSPSQIGLSSAPLPFTPTIQGRTNERNNGSSFEPCTAYTPEELRALGIDPATVEDAAISNSPNFRGCHWSGIRESPTDRDYLNYSQIVGKRITLEAYKREQDFRTWLPDRTVQGRRLAVATTPNDCTAVFLSEAAVVITGALPLRASPGLTRECDAAIAFAALAISKAP